jgi:Plasmid encoded RepA protein
MKKQPEGLQSVGDLLKSNLKGLKKKITGPSIIEQRLIDGAAQALTGNDGTPRDILYQHTVLCQTCMPFRDPGDDVRTWKRLNGGVALEVNAGKAMHPVKEDFVELGLPFGPKARLVLMHINQIALQQKTPEIEIQDSLTAFVRRTLNLDPNGRNMRTVKDQLARLSAASIRLGIARDGHAITVDSKIVSAFDIWFPKNENQRVLWPSTVRLSLDYWESLKAHAVPLDEDHMARLSHSAMALDIYAWLANRLHRIPKNRPAPVSWTALHFQFGQGYASITKFRQVFRVALREVRALYRAADVRDPPKTDKPTRTVTPTGEIIVREQPSTGLMLYNSPPPVSPR